MTLKEKLTNAISLPFSYQNKIDESVAILEEFAIEFAEWCGVPVVDADVKELLEIFKKEKGL